MSIKYVFNPTTGNLDATDKVAFNGEVNAGSAASPSVFFTGDPDTGLFSPGLNQVALSTNGTGRLFIDASGQVGVNSAPRTAFGLNIAPVVGQNNALMALIAGANTAVSRLDFGDPDAADAGRITYNHAVNELELRTNGGPGVFVDSSGNIAFGNGGTSDNNTFIGHPSADTLTATTNGSERLRITQAGLVGIGSSSPDALLTVNGVAAFGSGSAAAPAITRSGDLDTGAWYPADNTYALSTFGTERLRITSQGFTQLQATAGVYSPTAFNNSNLSLNGLGSTVANNACLISFASRSGDGNNSIGLFGAISPATGNAPSFVWQRWLGGATYAESMRLDSSGRLGIGTTSPGGTLDVGAVSGAVTAGDLIVSTGSTTAAVTVGRLSSTSGDNTRFRVRNRVDVTLFDVTQGTLALGPVDTAITFATNTLERGRWDSSGRLLVGTSSARSNFLSGGWAPTVQIETATNGGRGLSIVNNRTDNNGPQITFGKANGSAIGSADIVLNNDTLGAISFTGADGTNLIQGARIEAAVDGTPGLNDMPCRIVLSTTADGAASPTEQVRITSEGHLWIGSGSANPGYGLSSTGAGWRKDTSTFYVSAASNPALRLNRNGDGAVVEFRHTGNAVAVGSISVTSTATAYNTSSDYRLKENVVAVTDGITRLQQLKPSRFNFTADPDKTVDGFIAHEVQTIVPEAITGEKDAVDDEGNPVYQGIDQSKLVPLLTAALQEAIGEIESLKARVAALESA